MGAATALLLEGSQREEQKARACRPMFRIQILTDRLSEEEQTSSSSRRWRIAAILSLMNFFSFHPGAQGSSPVTFVLAERRKKVARVRGSCFNRERANVLTTAL